MVEIVSEDIQRTGKDDDKGPLVSTISELYGSLSTGCPQLSCSSTTARMQASAVVAFIVREGGREKTVGLGGLDLQQFYSN